MAEAKVRLNASRIRAELNKLVADIVKLNAVQREQVKASVRVNKIGRTYITVVTGMGTANRRFKETIVKVNGELKSVTRTTDTAANKADKLAAATKRAAEQQKRLAGEARKTTKSLQRQSFGPRGQTGAIAGTGGRATQVELFNFQNELGKLSELQQRHSLTSKQVLAQWRVIAAGRVNAETGVRRKVQAQLLKIKQAHQRLGQDAARAQQRIQDESKKTLERLKRGTKATNTFRLSWQSLIRIAAISLGLRAINAFVGAIREGITAAKDFSIAVAEVQTIDRANVSTQQWTASLRELSDSFGIDITDQAEAAYQALSNQIVTGADATEFLASANRLAITAVTDTSTAVKILTATLNAFDIDASRTEEISAKLFKTVELGRLRLDEIADRFGRVAVPASQLGVTLDELNAALATVTIRGVKAEEATTLLRNIFLKLIRPTEAMKDFLAELGFNSGQAAIETLGLEGVLIKLEERTRGSASELGELFGRIRAITGAMIFAGEGTADFGRNLDIVSKSQETFAERTDIITQSAGFELRKVLNEIANIFKIDIGQESLEAVRRLTGGFQFLVTTTKIVLVTLRVLTFTTIPALIIAVGILTKAFIVARIALVKLVVTNPLFLFAAAMGVVVAALLEVSLAQERAAQAAIDAAKEQIEAAKKIVVEEAKSLNQRITNQLDFFKQRQRLTLTSVAEIIGEINTQAKAQIEATELVTKAIKAQLKDLASAAKNETKKAGDAFDKTTDRIEKLKEDIRTAFESEGRTIFDLRFNIIDDDPEAQIRLITKRLVELKRLSQTTTDIKLFDSLRKEIIDLAKQRGAILTQNVKQNQQQEAINAFAEDLNATLTESVRLRQKLLLIQQEALVAEEKRKVEAVSIEARIAAALAIFNKFDPKALTSLTGEDAVETVNKAFAERRSIIEEILKLEATRGASTSELVQIRKQLTDQTLNQEDQIIRIRLENERKVIKTRLDGLKQNLKDAKIQQAIDEQTQKDLARRVQEFTDRLRDPSSRARATFLVGDDPTLLKNRARQAAIDEIVVDLDNFTKALIGGRADLIENSREIAAESIKALRENGVNIEDFFNAFDPGKVGTFDAIKNFFGEIVETQRPLKVLNDESRKLAQEQAKLATVIRDFTGSQAVEDQKKAIRGFIDDIAKAQEDLKKVQSDTTESQNLVNEALETGKENLDAFNVSLQNLTDFLNEPRVRELRAASELRRTEDRFRGGFVRGFDQGGFVPKGTDTVPAMLTPGEFVMNANASRKFAAQLVSMNSNIQPQRFQNGGSVSNNNNITVNLQVDGSTQSPDQIATEIGRRLNQQARRGTFSFNNN